MRVWPILVAIAFAGAFAAAAQASARPVTALDRALLARPATYEERIGEQVARRLTGHDASVRCGSLGTPNPNVLGVTPLLKGHSFDYFLMRPAACTYLAWFRQSPSRWDPRSCSAADFRQAGKHPTALRRLA